MTPFFPAQPNALAISAFRGDLLSKPRESFRGVFGGRIPSEAEKVAVVEQTVQRMLSCPIYQNDLYTVQAASHPPFIHLSIRRNDWGLCQDWRDFQRIKNELVGVENEAVEIFPAESHLVDTSNTYHLWVHSDPSFRFPFGLPHRMVTADPIGPERQRAVA
jgi:hypothetical protein